MVNARRRDEPRAVGTQAEGSAPVGPIGVHRRQYHSAGLLQQGASETSASTRPACDAASDVLLESIVDLVPMIRSKVGKVGLATPRLFEGEEANISNL
ncbi:hypothetical protein RC74_10965 [Falsihalocynthiibacter arcticus]|uniref:Uncharacterized protein n=1 Tax=Falsihalocynthiibacter arcticus TaxID=1579316 RepID=A0A126V079_9RHOB|nr:hypothetical protein RC74_10965 [Falsihalocynthiibacter arcticus]